MDMNMFFQWVQTMPDRQEKAKTITREIRT